MSILNDIKEKFNEKPMIIRLLYVVLIIAFVYELINGIGFGILFAVALQLVIISELINWFFHRE